jgi:hypothetical protein
MILCSKRTTSHHITAPKACYTLTVGCDRAWVIHKMWYVQHDCDRAGCYVWSEERCDRRIMVYGCCYVQRESWPQGVCGAVPCQGTISTKMACMNTCHENVTCHGKRMSVLICCMTAQPEAQSWTGFARGVCWQALASHQSLEDLIGMDWLLYLTRGWNPSLINPGRY